MGDEVPQNFYGNQVGIIEYMIICQCILCVSDRECVIVGVFITLGFTMMNESNILTGVFHDDTDIEFVRHVVVGDTDNAVTDHKIIGLDRVRITIDDDVSENFEIR